MGLFKKETLCHIEDIGNSKVQIDSIIVPTIEKEFVSANILGVDVGTTGYRGGDSGHGGRTYIKFKDHASTDMRVRVNNGKWVELMSNGPLEIAFGGDCELDTLIEALSFALETLKKQSK